MERVELSIGTFGVKGDQRELVSFEGEEIAKIEHVGSTCDYMQFVFTLYSCSGGYRVAASFVIDDPKEPTGSTLLVPDSLDENRGLLTREEVRSMWPALLVQAGVVRSLDVDAEEFWAEKRQRVANFGRIMRLVHSE